MPKQDRERVVKVYWTRQAYERATQAMAGSGWRVEAIEIGEAEGEPGRPAFADGRYRVTFTR